jgi:ABC-2 type transport system permease protein
MKAQLSSEVRKLLTTRTIYWFVLAAVALSVMAVVSISGQPASEMERPFNEQQFLFLSTFVKLFIVVVGIRIVTDEYRYGTVMPTFTFSPRRGRVIAAKAIVGAIAGLIIAVIAEIVLVGTAAVVFSTNGADLAIGSGGIRALIGGVVAGALWAVIGVGIGAIVRNQVVAIVGTFVWLMALEDMLQPRLGDLGDFLPGAGGFALSMGFSTRISFFGAATLLAYAAVALAAGVLITRKVDVGKA